MDNPINDLFGEWEEIIGITQSRNILTDLSIKYRKVGGILQFLVYSSDATDIGFDNLSNPTITNLISAEYTKAGLASNIAIGYSAGYTNAYLQNEHIVLSVSNTGHYQSALLSF